MEPRLTLHYLSQESNRELSLLIFTGVMEIEAHAKLSFGLV